MMNTLCENREVYMPERNDLPGYSTSWGVRLPRYRSCCVSETPSGLYLALFHGRKTPDEDMEDWGFDGPMIGPLSYVHTTYRSHLWLGFSDPDAARRYFP